VIIDAAVPLSKQIFQIIHLGEKYQKALLIIINKCDLIDKEKQKDIENQIRARIKSLRFVPLIFLSAAKGTGIKSLFTYLEQLFQQSQKQFNKKILQQCLEGIITRNPPPYYGKKKLKIYFIQQEKGLVRYFILFVNNKRYIHFSYQRYITNYLREKLDLKYLPIRLVFKNST
jgi:GTP-binding protein